MPRIGRLKGYARQQLDRLLVLPLHEIDQSDPLIPGPAHPRLRSDAIGLVIGKGFVELTQHEPVVSNFFVKKRICRKGPGSFAAYSDGSLELSHRAKDMTLRTAHDHAVWRYTERILQRQIGRVKVSNDISGPMIENTRHNCESQTRQSGTVIGIEIDGPLIQRACGLVIFARSHVDGFSDVRQL